MDVKHVRRPRPDGPPDGSSCAHGLDGVPANRLEIEVEVPEARYLPGDEAGGCAHRREPHELRIDVAAIGETDAQGVLQARMTHDAATQLALVHEDGTERPVTAAVAPSRRRTHLYRRVRNSRRSSSSCSVSTVP